MAPNDRERVVQGAFVLNGGGLSVDVCHWFWELSTDQMKEELEGVHRIWARVHSPNDPCRSIVFVTVPTMNSEDPLNDIPVKVGCKGLSARRVRALWNEVRGRVDSRARSRFRSQILSLVGSMAAHGKKPSTWE